MWVLGSGDRTMENQTDEELKSEMETSGSFEQRYLLICRIQEYQNGEAKGQGQEN